MENNEFKNIEEKLDKIIELNREILKVLKLLVLRR